MKKFLLFSSLISLLVSGWAIFIQAPAESSMGIVQKIMYLHVPSVWIAFLSFTTAFCASVFYLWKRRETADIIACCAVEIGVVFCAVTLLTGSIWGKPTWNAYWSWDARLTTTLILFLIFSGYLLLRKFSRPGEQQARLAAVIAIVGFFDLPLIHMSVVWWRTLHQPPTFFSSRGGMIDASLLFPLWLSLLTFSLTSALIFSLRVELERKRRRYLRQISNI